MGELLAQGQVLESELAVAADEKGRSRRRWSRRVITSRECGHRGLTWEASPWP
jgi:hypothetical protein